MKKPQIAILQGRKNLAGLEPFLGRLGFVGKVFTQTRYLQSAMRKTVPDLILVDRELAEGRGVLETGGPDGGKLTEVCPVLLVAREGDFFLFFDRFQQQVFHLVDLHDFFRGRLESYSRKHLRMEVDLPGLLSLGNSSHFAQIVNLGTGGAFVKTGYPHLEKNDFVEMTIPLLGQNAELEVRGRVVYRIQPSQENNYFQGVGVSFAQPDEDSVRQVREYLASTLAEEPFGGCLHDAAAGAFSPGARPESRRTVGILPNLR